MVDADPGFVYYGALTPGRTRDNPAGVVRRKIVEGHPHDEAFSRSLRWQPTTSLREEQLGLTDLEHIEISEAEAFAFVERVTARQS